MARIDYIQIRRGTAASWTSADPVLAAGEPGFESDTGLIKIGDGSTSWTSLNYIFVWGAITGTLSNQTDLQDLLDDKFDVVKIHAGVETLSSGVATVSAAWVTANSRIVLTAINAPSIPGTTLYTSNITASTSFDINSEDVTDSRDVHWLAVEE